MTKIQKILFQNQDRKYRDFQAALIPTIGKSCVIGVRTPRLRSIAREIKRTDRERFLAALPHKFYDENQLHAILLSEIRDFEDCLRRLDAFLPFVDNWATCDILRPRSFRQHHRELLAAIKGWLGSEETYTMRFGIEMLMVHYLDEEFCPEFLDWVAAIKTDEYYLKMMQAWFFAEALVKQWDAAIGVLETKRLERWTHNKAIQKARESFRISEEKKEFLKVRMKN